MTGDSRFPDEIITSPSDPDTAAPPPAAPEPEDWIAAARRFSRPKVIAAGLSDADIDRLIKQAQKDVEPRLG